MNKYPKIDLPVIMLHQLSALVVENKVKPTSINFWRNLIRERNIPTFKKHGFNFITSEEMEKMTRPFEWGQGRYKRKTAHIRWINIL